MKQFKLMLAAAAMAVVLPVASPAVAQEFPLVSGEYSEVTGIFVSDGSEFRYAEHLAERWAAAMEYQKSQGWISGYKIYMNVNQRAGEPTLYLMTTFDSPPDAAEQARREAAMRQWSEMGLEEQIEESGTRAEYRKLHGSMLLQEYTVR
ncbi:MAG: hypothetical protein ACX930_09530 [Erythrobacter sp.]